jgi:ABC-type sugar transport system ATPase subunit
MIYVTHDQIEAMTLGDRVVVMKDGEIRQIGTPLEVYDQPADRFVAQFIGSPPMNLIEGTLVQQHRGWKFSSGAVEIEAVEQYLTAEVLEQGRGVVLGVRAEAVTLERVAASGESVSGFRVEHLEALGDSTLVHVVSSEQGTKIAITAKLRERTEMKVGDRVRCTFDCTRLHWFDQGTGRHLPEMK